MASEAQDGYRQMLLLYRNLLRLRSGALPSGAIYEQAAALTGVACLPSLKRRDAVRLARGLPWDALDIWRACRTSPPAGGRDLSIAGGPASRQQDPRPGSWSVWECLPVETQEGLLSVFGAQEPAGRGWAWEAEDEAERLMQEPPHNELAAMLAGKGA